LPLPSKLKLRNPHEAFGAYWVYWEERAAIEIASVAGAGLPLRVVCPDSPLVAVRISVSRKDSRWSAGAKRYAHNDSV
jgi:hypothetical protein